jgi:seryl-tRNA synthetase
MLKRLKENFEGGVEKIKWFSSLLSERLKIEISLIRLLYQTEQLGGKRDELLKKIGQRTYDLREKAEAHILKDSAVAETLSEIAKINEEIESTRKKASEISKLEE